MWSPFTGTHMVFWPDATLDCAVGFGFTVYWLPVYLFELGVPVAKNSTRSGSWPEFLCFMLGIEIEAGALKGCCASSTREIITIPR